MHGPTSTKSVNSANVNSVNVNKCQSNGTGRLEITPSRHLAGVWSDNNTQQSPCRCVATAVTPNSHGSCGRRMQPPWEALQPCGHFT